MFYPLAGKLFPKVCYVFTVKRRYTICCKENTTRSRTILTVFKYPSCIGIASLCKSGSSTFVCDVDKPKTRLAALPAYVKTSPQQQKINPNNKHQKPKLTLKPGRTLQVADTAALNKLYCEASTQLLYDK